MVDDKDNLLAWIALNIINRQKRIKLKLRKKGRHDSMRMWFSRGIIYMWGGGRDFVSG